ncbi:uncharacterized protein V1516DRAFT_118976 [Lipomyces oligophaga]|uniref:uncharacterized protein n=1 Tax=Lipomyces oligophaga TaxID=45792 RepID=UPI0034CDEB0B
MSRRNTDIGKENKIGYESEMARRRKKRRLGNGGAVNQDGIYTGTASTRPGTGKDHFVEMGTELDSERETVFAGFRFNKTKFGEHARSLREPHGTQHSLPLASVTPAALEIISNSAAPNNLKRKADCLSPDVKNTPTALCKRNSRAAVRQSARLRARARHGRSLSSQGSTLFDRRQFVNHNKDIDMDKMDITPNSNSSKIFTKISSPAVNQADVSMISITNDEDPVDLDEDLLLVLFGY